MRSIKTLSFVVWKMAWKKTTKTTIKMATIKITIKQWLDELLLLIFVIAAVISNEIFFCILFSPFRSLREVIYLLYKIWLLVIFCWNIDFNVIFMGSKNFTQLFDTKIANQTPLSKQPINTVLFHSNIFHFLYSSLLCTLCKAILYDRIFSIHSKSKF